VLRAVCRADLDICAEANKPEGEEKGCGQQALPFIPVMLKRRSAKTRRIHALSVKSPVVRDKLKSWRR